MTINKKKPYNKGFSNHSHTPLTGNTCSLSYKYTKLVNIEDCSPIHRDHTLDKAILKRY